MPPYARGANADYTVAIARGGIQGRRRAKRGFGHKKGNERPFRKGTPPRDFDASGKCPPMKGADVEDPIVFKGE